jgi:hypothetical protein
MDEALKTMISNMPEKTGKSLEEWKKLLAAKTFEKHMQAVNYLKKEHGVSHGFANTIVLLSKEEEDKPEDLVKAQYEGRENLIAVYEKIVSLVKDFGEDVVITPKKTTVSLIRKKQFALIKPATKSRIDLGLKLRNKGTGERLQDSGPFGTMCTHRVQLTDLDEVDSEVISWLKEAYEEAN